MPVKIKSYTDFAIKGVGEGTRAGMLATAIKVVSQAKALAPVDSGELKGSIMWKSNDGEGLNTAGDKLSEAVGQDEIVVGTAAIQGIYTEYGTRRMGAQPWFRVAIDIVVNGVSYLKAVKKAMDNSVSKVVKKA